MSGTHFHGVAVGEGGAVEEPVAFHQRKVESVLLDLWGGACVNDIRSTANVE